ncbi:MAG: hypothetical protein JW748_00065 [Anaerolineales bacterium]|nr:hypothetical protein [Anaerolineales bacterium]
MKDRINITAHKHPERGLRRPSAPAPHLRGLLRPSGGTGVGTGMGAARRNRRARPQTPEFGGKLRRPTQESRVSRRFKQIPAGLAVALALLVCLGGIQGRSQENSPQEMRGLDEQVQEIKSEVLEIAAELAQLEEKLLYPSGTQIAIFVALAEGERMRLDAVRLEIDGQPVAHYIYSAKELEALRKGGVQRIYVGNVATGEHRLDVHVEGQLEGGEDFSPAERFTFRKEVKPKLVELTLAGPGAGGAPITLGEW